MELPALLMLNAEAAFDFSLSVSIGSNVPHSSFHFPSWLCHCHGDQSCPHIWDLKPFLVGLTLRPWPSIIKVYCFVKEEFLLLLLKDLLISHRENRLFSAVLKIYIKEKENVIMTFFLVRSLVRFWFCVYLWYILCIVSYHGVIFHFKLCDSFPK